MTGRIEVLSMDDAAGCIRAEDGARVSFRVSEITFGDATHLAVGQLVTFDMERGTSPRAFNIRIEKHHYNGHEKDKLWQSIRYLDFDQTGNVRKYKFERLTPGGEAFKRLSVPTCIVLKHRIGIQDGPMLCLRLVMAELDDSDATEQAPFRRLLTDHDMLCHLASRPVPRRSVFGRRPGAANTLPPTHAWRGTGPRYPVA